MTPPAPQTHVGLDAVLHLRHARHGVVQRGHVGDDGLLIRLCHVHVCRREGVRWGTPWWGGRGLCKGDPPRSPQPVPSGSSSRVTPRSRSATVKAWSRFSRLLWRYTRLMSISIGLWVGGSRGHWGCGDLRIPRRASPPLSGACLLCLYSCQAILHPTPGALWWGRPPEPAQGQEGLGTHTVPSGNPGTVRAPMSCELGTPTLRGTNPSCPLWG